MNKFLRWPALVILAALIIAALVPVIAMRHEGRASSVHAAGITPSITVPAILHPFDTVTITGQGFAAGDSVRVDLTLINNSVNLMMLSCDSNGNCSGQGSIPYTNVPQGTYQVNATGTTGLTAQATVAIAPGVATAILNSYYASPPLTAGGPGTAFQLIGGGFNGSEPINIYWGANNAVLLDTTSSYSDGSFNLSIHAPVTAIKGYYPITVARTNQTPANVRTFFSILPPRLVSSAGVLNSQPVHVRLSGFAASEQVALSWNANSGQSITMLTMDNTGATDTYVVPPFAPKGAYTLLAVGNTSKLQAQSSLTIGPGILLSLNTENPGGSTTVSGGGFIVGETINVYFQKTSNGITSVMADASGSFSVTLAVPVAHMQNTPYFVYAVSTTTKDNAKAQFFYATPSLQQVGNYLLTYGNSFTVAGAGFVANETVTLSAQNINQKFPVKLGTATTASDGSFTFTSTMPSGPYPPKYGEFRYNIDIIAHGANLYDKAALPLDVAPAIFATPNAAQPGQKIHVNGGGFGAGETVTISEQSTQIATAIVDSNGIFNATAIVPTSVYPGRDFNCDLCAIGNTSGAQADFFLNILPAVVISPDKGPSGTTITVNGYAIPSNAAISIYWFDPGTSTQTLLTSFNQTNGYTFQVTVTAPANLTGGKTYEVQARDASGMNIQLPFQAT